jgi:hypothetical protein
MTLKALIPVPALVMMAAALMLPAPAAHAAPMTFTAILSAANEVQTPPVVSPATGLATIVLDPTAHTLQVSATFSGLLSNTVAAHIHCCAPVGANAGVATTVPAFPGFPIQPLGVTSGTYGPMSFNLTQSLIYNPAFVTLQGGLLQAEETLVAGIIGGLTYFNIHTVGFPSGEIRGQLAPVPLPAALPLFAAGLGIVTFLARRKKTKAVSPA